MQDSKSPLGKPWVEITREERYFCAELFFEIRKDIKKFIQFLNKYTKLNLAEDQEWEIGYEVCFYRDYLYDNGIGVKATPFHDKRTFDLCLFSQNPIVVFEAKVFQNFDEKQLKSLEADIIKDISSLLKISETSLRISGALLYSTNKKKPEIGTIQNLELFTWEDLFNFYPKTKVFKVANEVPLKPKPKRLKAQS